VPTITAAVGTARVYGRMRREASRARLCPPPTILAGRFRRISALRGAVVFGYIRATFGRPERGRLDLEMRRRTPGGAFSNRD